LPFPEKKFFNVQMGVILEIINKAGAMAGKAIPLKSGQSVTIGRAAGRAEFAQAHDTFMSGVHFAVECGASGCRVVDRKSSNGTFLNGAKIQDAILANGDEIKAGQTVFHVKIVADEKLAGMTMPQPGAPPPARTPPRAAEPPAESPRPSAPPRRAEESARIAEERPPARMPERREEAEARSSAPAVEQRPPKAKQEIPAAEPPAKSERPVVEEPPKPREIPRPSVEAERPRADANVARGVDVDDTRIFTLIVPFGFLPIPIMTE
jgi:hypothetical protein